MHAREVDLLYLDVRQNDEHEEDAADRTPRQSVEHRLSKLRWVCFSLKYRLLFDFFLAFLLQLLLLFLFAALFSLSGCCDDILVDFENTDQSDES